MISKRQLHARAARLAIAGLVALVLAGCMYDATNVTTAVEPDYRLRHPIEIIDGTERLEIFVRDAKTLDPGQRDAALQFFESWRQRGKGPIVAVVPRGNSGDAAAARTLEALRQLLARAHRGDKLRVGNYPADPVVESPILLSFRSVQAQVHACGDWSADPFTDNQENMSYPEFGCASQKTLSAQIADPRDLVRPRAEDPSDALTRAKAISSLRGN